jgi:hypothetical protein
MDLQFLFRHPASRNLRTHLNSIGEKTFTRELFRLFNSKVFEIVADRRIMVGLLGTSYFDRVLNCVRELDRQISSLVLGVTPWDVNANSPTTLDLIGFLETALRILDKMKAGGTCCSKRDLTLYASLTRTLLAAFPRLRRRISLDL